MLNIVLESLNPVSIKLTSHHLLSTLLVNTVCNLGRECFKPSDSQTSQAAKMKTGIGIEIESWSNQDMKTGIYIWNRDRI